MSCAFARGSKFVFYRQSQATTCPSEDPWCAGWPVRQPTCAVAASCSRGAVEAEAPLALVSRPSGEACSRLSSATRTLSPASACAVDSSWGRVREGFSERGGEGSVRSIADRRHLKRYGIRQLQFDKGAEPNEQRTLLLALNNVKRIHAHDFPIISGESPGGLS